MTSPHLSVVIPAYNERETLPQILDKVKAVSIDKEIIIVDDGSTDGTRQALVALRESLDDGLPQSSSNASRNRLRVVLQPENRGKGAALREGFKNAAGDIVLIQDADLELDPTVYPQLLEPIESGFADVVFGSRFLMPGTHRVGSFRHRTANRLLTALSNTFTNLDLTDVWTCYKVFRRDVLSTLVLKEDRFGFEPEVTAMIARGGWRVYEVPVGYNPRSPAQGKKIGARDALRGFWITLKYGMRRG